jgi:hypothetical protein
MRTMLHLGQSRALLGSGYVHYGPVEMRGTCMYVAGRQLDMHEVHNVLGPCIMHAHTHRSQCSTASGTACLQLPLPLKFVPA